MKNPTVMQRAMTRMVQRHPFYATIAMNMNIVMVPEGFISELSGGVSDWAATDGTHMWFNEAWFSKLPLEQAVGVLQHEVEHVARMHPFRMGARDPGRWNYAGDAIINHSIVTNGGALPPGCVDGTPWAGKSEEQVYSELPKPPKKPQGGGGQGKSGQNGGGQGKSGQNGHDAVIKAKDQSATAQAKAKQLIAKAAHVAKAKGQLPAHLQAEIDDLLNPTVDWREPLLRFMTEVAATDYSWARINRRFVASGIYLPGLASEGAMRKLGILIDTSGSIGQRELAFYFSEVCGAIEQACPSQLVVAYCDAEVQHADVFDSNPTVNEVAATKKRHGGGGTSMPAGLSWYEENHPDVAAVIVLTDMYTDFGNEPGFPVLWATENETATAPYGETLRIKFDGE